MQTYAWLSKIDNAINDKQFALWDFNQYCGTSFVGELQTAPFYIFNILFAIVIRNVTPYSIDMYILFHYLCAAIFMFLLLMHNKKTLIGSVVGGIMFAGVGSVAERAYAQPNIFMASIWLPITLLLYQLSIEVNNQREHMAKKLFLLTTGGICLANMLLAGHMQPYIHGVVALVMFGVVAQKGVKNVINNILQLLFLGIVSLVMCFGQVLSGLEYMSQSYRWVGLDEPVKGFAKLSEEAYELVVMKFDFISNFFKDHSVIGDACTVYISIIGCVFAIIGIIVLVRFKDYRDNYSVYSVFLLILSLMTAFGRNNPVGYLFTVLPGFNTIREPARILYLYAFSVSSILALGVSYLFDLIDMIGKKKTRKVFSVCCGFVIVLGFGLVTTKFNGVRLSDAYNPESANVKYQRSELICFLEDSVKNDISNGTFFRYTCNTNEETLTPNLGSKYSLMHGTMAHRATMYAKYYEYLNKYSWDWTGQLAKSFSIKYFISNVQETNDNLVLVGIFDDKYLYEIQDTNTFFLYSLDAMKFEPIEVQNIKITSNKLEFDSSITDNGYLRISQLNYPGWVAYINGKKVDLIEDNEGFMMIEVLKGINHITFEYKPIWFVAWGMVLIIFFTILGWSIFFLKKKYRLIEVIK